MIEVLLRLGIREVDLILLGDIYDFQSLYPTQVTLIKGAWQSYAAADLIDWIVETFESKGIKVAEIIIVEGNHDRRIAEGMRLSESLIYGLKDMSYDGRAFVTSHYIDQESNVLYRHALLMRRSGSYIYGISPRMLREAIKLISAFLFCTKSTKTLITTHTK